jgi:hypothetical protein
VRKQLYIHKPVCSTGFHLPRAGPRRAKVGPLTGWRTVTWFPTDTYVQQPDFTRTRTWQEIMTPWMPSSKKRLKVPILETYWLHLPLNSVWMSRELNCSPISKFGYGFLQFEISILRLIIMLDINLRPKSCWNYLPRTRDSPQSTLSFLLSPQSCQLILESFRSPYLPIKELARINGHQAEGPNLINR